jgi:hypothetical protein
LIGPEDGEAVPGPVVRFEWEAEADATDYSLHICEGLVWCDANMIFSEPVGNLTEIELGGFPDDETLYIWRMRARNEQGWSDLSDMSCFVSGSSSCGPMRLATHLLIRYRVNRHVRYDDGSTGVVLHAVSIGSSFPDEGMFPRVIYDPRTRTYTVDSGIGVRPYVAITIVLDETYSRITDLRAKRLDPSRGDELIVAGNIPFSGIEDDFAGLGRYEVYRVAPSAVRDAIASFACDPPTTSSVTTGYSCDGASYLEVGIQRYQG